MPKSTRQQDKATTEEVRLKMKEKLDKVRSCMYIEPGLVFSLSHMFYVEKGLNDICMVYKQRRVVWNQSCGGLFTLV